MLKIAICDDDNIALSNLTSLLSQYQEEKKILFSIDTFHNASDLLDSLKLKNYQLLLMDILMPGITGIEAAHEIRSYDNETKIIFLTSSPEFGVESYSVDAYSYLLKPTNKANLFPILDKLMLSIVKQADSIPITLSSGIIQVPFSHIEFLEICNKHIIFHLEDGTTKELVGTLAEYESKFLCRKEFIKVHRSYIVNMGHIKNLEGKSIYTYSGQNVPVSRLLYSEIKECYFDYLFNSGGIIT